MESLSSIYEAVKSRASDLVGYMGSEHEVARLAKYLNRSEFSVLLRIYRELPVCGMLMAFAIDSNGNPSPPVAQSECDYDSARDHEFTWMSPNHVIEELEQALAGSAAFAAGFVPLGMCSSGGDGYFLRIMTEGKAPVRLFQVYYDWYDPTKGVLVIPEAVHLVCQSFDQAVRVAHFGAGIPRLEAPLD